MMTEHSFFWQSYCFSSGPVSQTQTCTCSSKGVGDYAWDVEDISRFNTSCVPCPTSQNPRAQAALRRIKHRFMLGIRERRWSLNQKHVNWSRVFRFLINTRAEKAQQVNHVQNKPAERAWREEWLLISWKETEWNQKCLDETQTVLHFHQRTLRNQWQTHPCGPV